jgi:hypothetical protein
LATHESFAALKRGFVGAVNICHGGQPSRLSALPMRVQQALRIDEPRVQTLATYDAWHLALQRLQVDAETVLIDSGVSPAAPTGKAA